MTLLALGALVVPWGSAVAKLDITDSDVFNEEGQALTRVAIGDPVRLQAVVKDTANASYNGTVSVVFTIFREGAIELNRTVTVNTSIPANGQSNVTLSWVAGKSGTYSLETYIEDDRTTLFTLTFIVAESEVVRATLVERVVEYAWFYVAFVFVVVLFFAVGRARRPR